MNTACVLMAAGASLRFDGGSKLLADFEGLPVYVRALNAIPAERFYKVAVVSGEAEILRAAEERGFIPVVNNEPSLGASRSVRLGMEALPDADALLFMVADQPCLRAGTVRALLDLARTRPGKIIRPCCKGHCGNPVLFPSAFFPELLALTGDKGGGAVCARHPEAVCFFEPENERELADIDKRKDMEELRRSCAAIINDDK